MACARVLRIAQSPHECSACSSYTAASQCSPRATPPGGQHSSSTAVPACPRDRAMMRKATGLRAERCQVLWSPGTAQKGSGTEHLITLFYNKVSICLVFPGCRSLKPSLCLSIITRSFSRSPNREAAWWGQERETTSALPQAHPALHQGPFCWVWVIGETPEPDQDSLQGTAAHTVGQGCSLHSHKHRKYTVGLPTSQPQLYRTPAPLQGQSPGLQQP